MYGCFVTDLTQMVDSTDAPSGQLSHVRSRLTRSCATECGAYRTREPIAAPLVTHCTWAAS
jgi:hypothetical protein